MKVWLDLSDGAVQPIEAEVLAIIYHEGQRLFAVKATLDGAPWYGLIHEDSDVLMPIAP
jgi:hypothetical protein